MGQFRQDYIPQARLSIHMRSDADEHDAAYRRSVANLNAWRTDDVKTPSQPVTGRVDAEDHDAAYHRSVASINAWRDAK